MQNHGHNDSLISLEWIYLHLLAMFVRLALKLGTGNSRRKASFMITAVPTACVCGVVENTILHTNVQKNR